MQSERELYLYKDRIGLCLSDIKEVYLKNITGSCRNI
jgi:hypothetical protein